jgi:acyl-CoA thioesterase-1
LGGRVQHYRRLGSYVVLFGALLATGCGGGPVTPNTLAPVLVCPAQTFQSPDGNAVAVTYEPPQVVAGQPPLKIACTPASGTVFPLGPTAVSCTVTDSALRTNACSFNVTVVRPPRLTGTRFLAFGNSITAGEIGVNYPSTLQSMLAQRYVQQASVIRVVNRGVGGERTDAGETRLPNELRSVGPNVLLLEEGVNDLFGGNAENIPELMDHLEDMVREAKRRNVTVLLATLLPTRDGSEKGDRPFPLVPIVNERIRTLAAAEGATLVDLYQGFGGNANPYISADGLHPTADGYRKMAEIFFERIRATLEEPQNFPPVIQFARYADLPGVP